MSDRQQAWRPVALSTSSEAVLARRRDLMLDSRRGEGAVYAESSSSTARRATGVTSRARAPTAWWSAQRVSVASNAPARRAARGREGDQSRIASSTPGAGRKIGATVRPRPWDGRLR